MLLNLRQRLSFRTGVRLPALPSKYGRFLHCMLYTIHNATAAWHICTACIASLNCMCCTTQTECFAHQTECCAPPFVCFLHFARLHIQTALQIQV